MNIDTELQDYEAAGSLAEELPYWGWLDDERTCLTRAGELMSMARVSPFVLDGQTPEQLDRVIDRWQRMLSGLDARTRFYFYLLRRPIHFPEVSPSVLSGKFALLIWDGFSLTVRRATQEGRASFKVAQQSCRRKDAQSSGGNFPDSALAALPRW